MVTRRLGTTIFGRGVAARLRLMLESPPPFRNRDVFVPSSYLSRA